LRVTTANDFLILRNTDSTKAEAKENNNNNNSVQISLYIVQGLNEVTLK